MCTHFITAAFDVYRIVNFLNSRNNIVQVPTAKSLYLHLYIIFE